MAARTNEPATAPQVEHWYPLVLGSSLKDQPSKRFYSLRYEFKPASIDTSQPGTLHKGVENKVTVEFSNNQPGKPKVSFQGISEDCKDSDAVLFFDGKTFRMERLHRAVKTLRHMRQPGESASGAAAAGLASGSAIGDTRSSPVHLNGTSADDTNAYRGPRQEHVEEIVIGSQPEGAGTKKKNGNKAADSKTGSKAKASPAPSPPLDRKRGHAESPTLDDETAPDSTKKLKPDNVELIDVNVNIDDEAGEEHESDYELEDVDVSEDEDGQVNKSAADPVEALRAQAAAANTDKPQSSSESGSSSSDSGSGSDSSSDSDGSEDESGSLGDI